MLRIQKKKSKQIGNNKKGKGPKWIKRKEK